MKKIFTQSFILIMVLWCSHAQAQNITAKQMMDKAIATATQWQADAVLTGISTGTVTQEGTAASWLYSFYSPQTKKFNIVTVKANLLDPLEVNTGFTEPIGTNFMDSPQAFKEALKQGIKGKTPFMAVNVMGGGGADKKIYWSVNGGFETGDISVVLKADTGELVVKHTLP